ncbi:hypothetical protein, partial [Streptococcus alactolyticus]
MAKGARIRSGPMPDENSARSDARGYRLEDLPASGYDGPVPDFPLPNVTDRESEVWEWAWRTPQACAWSMDVSGWLVRSVAMWTRLSVRCEDATVSAPVLGQLHRFAEHIGLTPAGLAALGWKITTRTASSVEAEAATPKR